jgi:acyl-coenzyme A thioesterase PaaI-like protein
MDDTHSGPDTDPRPPAGFEPIFRSSPFLDLTGPLFYRKEPDGKAGGFVIGMRILPKHANARGGAHGGLLLTLVDIALGYSAAFSQEPPAILSTASVTADFVGGAKIGDWVEAHVDVQKVGGRLAFANCFLAVVDEDGGGGGGGERIVRASAVYARSQGALPDQKKG